MKRYCDLFSCSVGTLLNRTGPANNQFCPPVQLFPPLKGGNEQVDEQVKNRKSEQVSDDSNDFGFSGF